MSERKNGTVKWFSAERGYGFVTIDGQEDGAEYFVHFSSINMEGYKNLSGGQKVTFELSKTDRGIQAINVEPVE